VLAESPDATRDIYAALCACGATLEAAGRELAKAWDHVDLPPIKPITTRVNLFRATCPCCKARVTAQAPADMPEGIAVRARHTGCGRLSARLPDGQLEASDRVVRRPVRPDHLPGRAISNMLARMGKPFGAAADEGRHHRTRQRDDRQR
jgi:hypothetical protein